MIDLSSAHWRKSSRSGSNGGDCVEVADTHRAIMVRDSKDTTGPVLTFSRSEWSAFLGHAKAGQFDR